MVANHSIANVLRSISSKDAQVPLTSLIKSMFTKGPVQVFPQGEELQLQVRTSSVTTLTHLCVDHDGLQV